MSGKIKCPLVLLMGPNNARSMTLANCMEVFVRD